MEHPAKLYKILILLISDSPPITTGAIGAGEWSGYTIPGTHDPACLIQVIAMIETVAGRYGYRGGDVVGKMVQIEEMTECSLGNEMDETDGGECTIDEGTKTERNSSLTGYFKVDITAFSIIIALCNSDNSFARRYAGYCENGSGSYRSILRISILFLSIYPRLKSGATISGRVYDSQI